MLEKVHFLLAKQEDAGRIVEFLVEEFFPQEPCSKALNLSPSQVRPIYTSIVDRCLEVPFTTIVTSSSGKIVAVLLNSIWRRDDSDGESADYDTDGDSESENLTKFVELLNKCHEGFWNLAPPHIHTVIHREVSCVSPGWQRRGIATRLVTESLTKSKIEEFGVGGVISETSSYANQALLLKQGFELLKEIPYSDVVDSQGNEILKTDDGAKGIRLNIKLIERFDL